MLIRVDDEVEVITGDDRGARGQVLRVDRPAGKVTVQGVNRVYKHVRRSQRNPQGGRLSKEMPICVSNVLLVCTGCSDATRMGVRTLEDGSRVRYCKKCNAENGTVSPPKARRANQQGQVS